MSDRGHKSLVLISVISIFGVMFHATFAVLIEKVQTQKRTLRESRGFYLDSLGSYYCLYDDAKRKRYLYKRIVPKPHFNSLP